MDKEELIARFISIHPPGAAGDKIGTRNNSSPVFFLPPPSLWGATQPTLETATAASISIHALREEGDPAFVRA